MDEYVRVGSYVALRLPSDTLKLIELQPNTTISLGKFGSFQANHIIGRPYHFTYEILDKPVKVGASNLRVVPASELHELVLGEPEAAGDAVDNNGVDYEVVADNGEVLMRTNQHIKDDGVSQKLTLAEIEALKKADSSGGKDVIAKILESHSALDKKTTFSLAKYTLRKTKKFIKRFTVLPLDVPLLANYLLDSKDGARIMDMREETLGLVTSYANVHLGSDEATDSMEIQSEEFDHNRWLVVDELSGLLVAALAEHMSILYPTKPRRADLRESHNATKLSTSNAGLHNQARSTKVASIDIKDDSNDQVLNGPLEPIQSTLNSEHKFSQQQRQAARIYQQESAMAATSNTITLVHQNVQPNLSLLTYFGFDVSNPNTSHPLYTNLKQISFLQLLQPQQDYSCQEPPIASEEELCEMKSRQKSAYYRKRRRWQRTKAIVDETQAGGFAGLVVASAMNSASILHILVPLLRGGAQVVVYSPTIEASSELMDLYSKGRRTAFRSSDNATIPSEEFPVDPNLLIGTSLHTTRSRPWQVLPGRTHPKMTGRGGPEGYVFVGTRVYPVEGKIEARGSNKRRKVEISNIDVRIPEGKMDVAAEEGLLAQDRSTAVEGSSDELEASRDNINGITQDKLVSLIERNAVELETQGADMDL